MKNRFCLIAFLFVYSISGFVQTTAQWRGPERNGIFPESNLLKAWPAEGPAMLWKTEIIGNGYGAPTVTAGRIFITGEVDSTGYLFAFTLEGKLLWKSEYGKEWVVNYQGSRCAPTVAGDLVYVCSGLGDLACFDAGNGRKKWSVDMIHDLHGRFTLFGHAESSLIDGDKVFLVPGGKDTNVVAMNRFTGKIIWISKGQGEIPGYNSPYLIKLPARHVLVTFTAYSMLGLDAQTGQLLWVHPQDNIPVPERKPGNGDTHSNTVIYDSGFIYYFAGDGNCAVKLELSADGKNIRQVWRNKTIDNYMGGFVKQGKYLYSCVSEKRQLKCLDAATGLVVDSLKCGAGSIILADSMLYYYNQKGEVRLVNPGQGKMVQSGFFKLTAGTKEHFSHPVVDKGVLYIRHGGVMVAYDVARK
ncbi:MAG: PQQ-binding-like beta-propeller repeat protein [Bacteroidetes bacterium]|nr:PQQ-binding-like beta-propeller repeat protein [Bacteroidota bacterium]